MMDGGQRHRLTTDLGGRDMALHDSTEYLVKNKKSKKEPPRQEPTE